jgi:hypothetical protein
MTVILCEGVVQTSFSFWLFFLVVLGFELRAYTLTTSLALFL